MLLGRRTYVRSSFMSLLLKKMQSHTFLFNAGVAIKFTFLLLFIRIHYGGVEGLPTISNVIICKTL